MGFKLVIIGEGKLIHTVLEYTKAFENIIHLGKQPRTVVLSEMRKFNAMIFPSFSIEVMSLSIIEAL